MFKRGLISASLCVVSVVAHGNVISPPPRLPGSAMAQACGQSAVSAILSDPTGPIENIQTNNSPNCNPYLCKGTQFADNQANVQPLAAGQTVSFEATIPIPHEGPCNVSIIDTATNSVVGQPLIVFDSYADENLAQLPPNNTAFSVTMPSNLGAKCQAAGECTMQWFWFGTNAQQTYEDCVDFVMTA